MLEKLCYHKRVPFAWNILRKSWKVSFCRVTDSAAQQFLTSVEQKLVSLMQVHALPMALCSVWVLS
ncbi:unnamed protein product [Ceratitis capitata]|uniref:(Mediterranean fruit fly) hypothetical protein n=1 Tax=Ceratitis capitata TaxID=7213 RepID=A0A811UZV7_CERCA|nr:unnamed protein product [Ceratitis capitata]